MAVGQIRIENAVFAGKRLPKLSLSVCLKRHADTKLCFRVAIHFEICNSHRDVDYLAAENIKLKIDDRQIRHSTPSRKVKEILDESFPA